MTLGEYTRVWELTQAMSEKFRAFSVRTEGSAALHKPCYQHPLADSAFTSNGVCSFVGSEVDTHLS